MVQNIVIVDICGTLYNSNTTFDFLDFYVKKKTYRVFRAISKNILWKIFNKICLVLLKVDVTRKIAVGFLRGQSKETLMQEVDVFYTQKLSYLEQKEVLELVRQYKSDGKRVILVSATLDFIAKKVSEKIDIPEVYSTELNYKGSVCQGTIQQDLLSNKLAFLKSKGFNTPFDVTITDNFSDSKLLTATKYAIIISKVKDKARWEKVIRISNPENNRIITV